MYVLIVFVSLPAFVIVLPLVIVHVAVCPPSSDLNVSVAYLPSAIGLMIGRGIGLPFHMVVYLGRWMNVLFLALICYYSMKGLCTGKIVVLLIALIPTNIFIAGNG